MSHSLLRIYLRPHLVPFLYQKAEPVSVYHRKKYITAAAVTNRTPFGRFLRLLIRNSPVRVRQKPLPGKLTYIYVSNQIYTPDDMDIKLVSSRNGFLYVPETAQQILNDRLDEEFETALMFYVHSRQESYNDTPLDSVIIDFFVKYDLDEYGFNIPQIRRNYYRKLKAGFFHPERITKITPPKIMSQI